MTEWMWKEDRGLGDRAGAFGQKLACIDERKRKEKEISAQVQVKIKCMSEKMKKKGRRYRGVQMFTEGK